MTSIVFWTSASVQAIKKIVGPALKRCPETPSHRFVSVGKELYVPAPDEICLAMGDDEITLMAEAGIVQKNRKAESLRGKIYPAGEGRGSYMISYSPDLVQLTARFAITGSTAAVLGEYRWVEHFEDEIAIIEAKYAQTGKPVPVSVDTETLRLSPFDSGSRVVAIGFTSTEGRADCAYISDLQTEEQAKKFLGSVRWLLTSDKVKLRLAHGKFDLAWVAEKWGIECTNFSMDTLLVGSMLDENRSNSLKTHVKHYDVLLGGYDDEMTQKDMENMDRVPKDKLLRYLGGDVDGTLRISRHMMEELKQVPETMRLYLTIVHPAAKVFSKIERNGILVDVEAYRELKNDLEVAITKHTKEGLDLLPARLQAKFADNLSLSRPALLKEYFFTPAGLNLKPRVTTAKSGEPSTAKSHLEMFHTVPEAKAMCSVLTDINQAKKALSTYVIGFLECLKPDGKFHPSYFMHQGDNEWGDDEGGTVTGRLSAKDPAVQCMVGETLVLTTAGWKRLENMVSAYENGQRFTVLTHTGEWMPVIGSYRNGVKPTLTFKLRSGREITCTPNHPILTSHGFIKAEHIRLGDRAFQLGGEIAYNSQLDGEEIWKASRAGVRNNARRQKAALPVRLREDQVSSYGQSDFGEHHELWLPMGGEEGHARAQTERASVPHLPCVVFDENTVPKPEIKGVFGLRRPRNYLRSCLGDFRGLPKIYGRVRAGVRIGTPGCESRLQQEQLLLDSSKQAKFEQEDQPPADVSRSNDVRGGVGPCNWLRGDSEAENSKRVVCGSSADDAKAAYEAGFTMEEIVNITFTGLRETFDLTIEGSHSFVANGVVVHNTVPKRNKWAKKIRKCLIAPEGYMILEADSAQGELKLTACVAEEPTMLDLYMNGGDLHTKTGAGLAGLEMDEMMALKESDKDQFALFRYKAKAANFGLIYGMGAEGFQRYAWNSYGLALTLEEAEKIRSAFFNTYTALPEWHKTYKNLAYKHGFVVSPLGRTRHLPQVWSSDRQTASKAGRQGINSPIQSTLSDMLCWAFAEIDAAYGDIIKPIASIHDAGYWLVPEDRVMECAVRVTDIMGNLPFEKMGWTPQLKFNADATAGRNLGQMEELKLAA
jgi:DNA polymerase I-like protein with 3'-5' exonuclease and polymerase domains